MSDQMLRLYKATLPSINYVFRNGKPAIFVQGRFSTGVPDEIAELDDEIAKGHPHIFVDAEEKEISSVFVDPIQALRSKIEAEVRAQMAAASNLSNDRGNYDQGKLVPASSTDVAVAAEGGSGAGLAARLMTITKK
jgi:hypothetical protein